MEKQIIVSNKGATLDTSRRNFLKLGGVGLAVAGLTLAGCRDDNYQYIEDSPVFDLGTGDVAVLNFAYALEQLEADFYTKVVNSFYTGISEKEKQLFTDIYYHEIIHRDFFAAALGGATDASKITPKLEFKYDGVDFKSRTSILATSKALEDTGVAAYNAAGKYLSNLDYLLIAGKIVSIEARHAAAIRDAINPGSKDFSGDDIIDVNGLDVAKEPKEIIAAAGPFIKTPFTWKALGIG